jgi:hypothetical protein
MSTRTELTREVVENFQPERLKSLATEDVTLYAGHLGVDAKGRDAVLEAARKFYAEANPTVQLKRDPVEEGNFVVAFAKATLASGEERDICYVHRYAGDQISGMWTMRA